MTRNPARFLGVLTAILLVLTATLLPAAAAPAAQPPGKLYAGGNFTTAGGRPAAGIAGWDGVDWSALTGPDGAATSGPVYTMTEYDGKLVVGGSFLYADGVPVSGIAAWDGTSWSSLTGASDSPGVTIAPLGFVSALAVWNGDLYVGGHFPRAGGTVTVDNLARWDGAEWSAVTGPSGTGTQLSGSGVAPVWDLTVHRNSLVVSGNFDTAGGVPANGVARWNGSAWLALGMPALGGLTVLALTRHQGDLIASRSYSRDNIATTDVVRLSGGRWSTLDDRGFNSDVRDLTVIRGELVAGGIFTRAGDTAINHVARWTGTNWVALGEGTGGPVYALTAHRGQLVAGGSFATAGGVPTGNIARWNGTAWSALPAASGVGTNDTVFSLLSA